MSGKKWYEKKSFKELTPKEWFWTTVIGLLLSVLLVSCLKSENQAELAASEEQVASETKVFNELYNVTPMWDINQIVEKPKAEVAAVLGEPSSCEPNKYGSTCRYEKDTSKWEITYIQDKADWISIEDERLKGLDAMLAPFYIGLKQEDMNTDALCRDMAWKCDWYFKDYVSVTSFFGKDDKGDLQLFYLYLKKNTK